ncbi:MAG TPA: ATP-binding protein [Vicinamibacterales bacterium]|nr:ATP-binding protein [Vicinamibacterales bacterium]
MTKAPFPKQQIRWHRRMEARVAAGVILLVALSLAGVVLATVRVTTRSSLQRASVNLQDARSAFYRLVGDRADFAASQTRLIIALPLFRSSMINPVIAGDVATLTESADSYRRDLGADFCILSDPQGTPITNPGWTGEAVLPPGLAAAIKGAAAGESRRDIVRIAGKLFLITSEPAKFADSEVLGTLTFGFILGDNVAQQLAQRTRSEINLVSGGEMVGSSLPADERRDLAATVRGGAQPSLTPQGISAERRQIGSRRFIEGAFSLFPDRPSNQVGQLVLLQDWAPTQQFIDELTRSLLLAGTAAFVIALAVGLIFSRRTSRPLMDMAAAARDIASGDWTRQVPVRGSAEAETMALSFNAMTSSLRDQADRLKSSYQRFSTVTQSARDAIISTDEHGNITFWNRSAEHVFGYPEHEVLGEPLMMLIAEADRAGYTAALPSPADNDLALGQTIEVTGRKKNGTLFPSEFSVAALRGPHGLALTAIVRDVTERKQAQDALQQRDEQLRQSQKMEAIGRLAGGVAHDFNNLLMAIRGYAELLAEGFDEGDERKQDADEILKASDRAAGLTRQLLAFSRRQVITQQAVALDQLVEETQNMLRRLIGEDVRLVTEVWPGLTPVLADRTQVEQILVNLVVNARDAMPNGGTISIELRNIELDKVGVAAHPGLAPGDYVEMSVGDTGAGMDSETASRIFEPFFTTKEDGKGTGLGLATVYGIVQQSGGAIEVQSKVGSGTTFYIYLPRATDLGKPAVPKLMASAGGSETVLLAEDDDRVRVLVANMLKKSGYKVLLASAGDQALEIAARHQGRIHLLLTDVVMPGMSGRVLSERLMLSRADTRVLYMSGYSDDAILRHGVKSASTHFIQKPFSVEGLAQKIREALASADAVPAKQ